MKKNIHLDAPLAEAGLDRLQGDRPAVWTTSVLCAPRKQVHTQANWSTQLGETQLGEAWLRETQLRETCRAGQELVVRGAEVIS